MDWGVVGAFGELIGAIAVVASLIYLARQIHGSAIQTQGANRNAMAQLTTQILMQLASDSELSRIFRRGQSAPGELTAEELFRFDTLLYAIFESWESAHSQWKRGSLEPEDWRKWETIIGMYLAHPGSQEFWKKSADNFSASFQSLVNDLTPARTYDFERVRDSQIDLIDAEREKL